MIKINDLFPINLDGMNIQTIEVSGWVGALGGMRNPMDSWPKSDSYFENGDIFIGENDMKLARNLISSGPEHAKFLRMIHVQANINMPRLFFSELDTYHHNTKNSQSTMHKLLNRTTPITKDLFVTCEEDEDIINLVVDRLESLRIAFKDIQKNCTDETKAEKLNHLLLRAKRALPEGFLQMRTVDTNYAELRTIYHQRKEHRLKEEWQGVFCKWVETLPYAKELIIE
jgi:hypothetical protein